MTRALAFVQFLIVCLGAMTLHLLVKMGGHDRGHGSIDELSQFLARHALWAFAVPILYAILATAFGERRDSLPLKITGLALCALLLLAFGIPLLHYLK